MVVMEEEINKFIMVWSSFIASTCYCYAVSKLVSQAAIRLLMFLPVLYLFFLLPLTIKSINLVVITGFSMTWLATFKLLLLVFHTGPLSNPSLSLFHFVLISCLPLGLRQPSATTKTSVNNIKGLEINHFGIHNINEVVLTCFPYFVRRSLIMIMLVALGFHKHIFPRDVFLIIICIYLYLSMEVILTAVAIVGQILLGNEAKVELPFNKPYLSTSLQDFWSYRWNRVGSSILQSTIFDPILHHTLPVLGRKWAALLALLATFLVSELMHEIVFSYVGRVRFRWGTPLFFLVQVVCVVIENMLKRRVKGRWEVPQVYAGPLIFGFQICTFMWLVLSELLEYKLDDRVLQEYADVCEILKNLVLTWSKMSYDLLVQPSILKQV
ncbi:acyl-CoA--sterol O-acyltransferase 1-like [Andrographis paniculata]|uniref:acyl-CoA--sterol O-acyltransferase 1-like n=1 Tax=Andrographis paniculata TaxID=175694 RepID=UPI0021E7348E|nr:acyl-CoA--sterol O-acyltransferase 1-like [Andrographis paniculata]